MLFKTVTSQMVLKKQLEDFMKAKTLNYQTGSHSQLRKM